MKAEDNKSPLEEPFTEYDTYSHRDYLSWQMDEMVELINKEQASLLSNWPKL